MQFPVRHSESRQRKLCCQISRTNHTQVAQPGENDEKTCGTRQHRNNMWAAGIEQHTNQMRATQSVAMTHEQFWKKPPFSLGTHTCATVSKAVSCKPFHTPDNYFLLMWMLQQRIWSNYSHKRTCLCLWSLFPQTHMKTMLSWAF